MAKLVPSVVLLLLSVGCSESPTQPSPPGSLTITSVSPSQGSTESWTTVMVKGAGFAPGAKVSIGTLVLPATVVSQESMLVSVPAYPPGVHDVVVTNPDGTSARIDRGFRFVAAPLVDHVPITVAGQVLAGDSQTPVARASIRLADSRTAPVEVPQSDDDGRFVLEGTVSATANTLNLNVAVESLGVWFVSIPRATADSAVVRLPELLMIRAGGQLTSELNFSNHSGCTFESVPCRRLHVVGPAGSRIDLELIAEEGQEVGLIVEETFLAPREYPKRVTVSPSTIWVMGAFGKFTLKARDPVTDREP